MIVSGRVVGDDLVLTRGDGTVVSAGDVRGPAGADGVSATLELSAQTGEPGTEVVVDNLGTPQAANYRLTIPRGATGSAAPWMRLAAGRPDIPGTLDPDTLAWRNAAPSGSTFYSTDGPQGAWVWRKRGSSWVCVEGDTGWRRYDPPLIGDQFANVAFFIRRANSQVTLSLQFDGAVTASVTYASYIPTGYKYRYRISANYVPITSTAAGGYIYLIENGNLYLRGYATGAVRTELPWSTTEAWPTTLPGTPA
jgi:hypothetical protein